MLDTSKSWAEILGYQRRTQGSSREWAKVRLRETYGNKTKKSHKMHNWSMGKGDQQGGGKGRFLWLLLRRVAGRHSTWQHFICILHGQNFIYNYNQVFEFLYYSCVKLFLRCFSCLFFQRGKKLQTFQIFWEEKSAVYLSWLSIHRKLPPEENANTWLWTFLGTQINCCLFFVFGDFVGVFISSLFF